MVKNNLYQEIMNKHSNRSKARKARHFRIRKKISGSSERPRLVVFRSNLHIYAQAVDDTQGITLESSSTLQLKKKNGATKESATEVGVDVAQKLLNRSIDEVVFDRGGYPFHGRVKSLAEGARKQGLKF